MATICLGRQSRFNTVYFSLRLCVVVIIVIVVTAAPYLLPLVLLISINK